MNASVNSPTLVDYWPIILVCIAGIVLVSISLLALLLIKGKNASPTTKTFQPSPKKASSDKQRKSVSQLSQIELAFCRIGRIADIRKTTVFTNCNITIGSGKDADFCLDTEDPLLTDIHFQIYINDAVLSVTAVGAETFVNGVPIRKLGTVPAYSGDLIRAGCYEYRVIFPYEEKGTSS